MQYLHYLGCLDVPKCMVADMVADMEVHMVTDMVADMAADKKIG